MSQKQIAAYQHTDNTARSVEKYAFLVKRIAQHLIARLPDSVLIDDLLQAGMLGLLEATGKYDPTKGASFETYAGIRIRGAMLDEMRRGDWAPRSVHRNARLVSDTIRRLEHENGYTPTDREIASAMDVEIGEYHAILRDAATCRLFSFEEVDAGDDPSVLPSVDGDDHGVERREMVLSLMDAIGELSEREQIVLSLYYDKELNLKEIGEVLEVSESRISQILSQCVSRLRTHISEWVES